MELSIGNLITFFTKGGPLMWPLLVFGLIGLGIAVERGLYFFTTGYPIEQFENELEQRFRAGSGDPEENVRRLASPWHRLTEEFLTSRELSTKVRDDHMERLGTHLLEEMRRRVGVLSTIAGVAPLVGLLGTIGGMMLAFQQIAITGGQADIGQLADGLWVAMITTFAGLTVAIPAQLAYGYFQSLVRRRVLAMNNLTRLLDELHQRETGAAFAAGDESNGAKAAGQTEER